MTVPDSTPVIVGVGQVSERIGEADYRAASPVDLAADAVRAAVADTGVDLAPHIDVLACTRQFDESFPGMPALLGRPENFPRSVASRVGAVPTRVIYEVSGGQSPQHLATELAEHVATGRADVAVIAGSEATSTVLHLLAQGDPPSFAEPPPAEAFPDGVVDPGLDGERGAGLEGMVDRYQAGHGLTDAPTQYALFENARRMKQRARRSDYVAGMGELFAPFTDVAAGNPHSAAPTVRSVAELVEVTDDNRMVVDPFPKALVSRDKVNQAAAVILTSVGRARALGVDEASWVYLAGHADLRDRSLLERPDLAEAAPAAEAIRAACRMAGVEVDALATLDLYSCFPVAVSVVCDALGLAPDDPRGLTLTGGLPYFGGPGNNYSTHAIVETVLACRRTPGSYGLVGANGGLLSKYSAGVYSTRPSAWMPPDDVSTQRALDERPGVPVASRAEGPATLETWTVKYGDAGPESVVIGRLESGERFLAMGSPQDTALLEVLTGEDLPTAGLVVRSTDAGNRVALDEETLDRFWPRPVPGFRTVPEEIAQQPSRRAVETTYTYDHLKVARRGRILEITIDRADARNALDPATTAELDGVWDAFAADPDLWVAIITGAGEKAFCAGNDLAATAGGAFTLPANGFGGLTSRRGLYKPVIAAVNGFALGGGFELALAADLVVAEEHAEFGLTEAKVGLVAGAGGLVRLPRTVPRAIANELIFTGGRMSAEDAAGWGLVNRVVARGESVSAARELAERICEASPTSVRLSKEWMERADSIADPIDAIEGPSDVLDRLLVSRDTTEGILAFLSKRAPDWKNL